MLVERTLLPPVESSQQSRLPAWPGCGYKCLHSHQCQLGAKATVTASVVCVVGPPISSFALSSLLFPLSPSCNRMASLYERARDRVKYAVPVPSDIAVSQALEPVRSSRVT